MAWPINSPGAWPRSVRGDTEQYKCHRCGHVGMDFLGCPSENSDYVKCRGCKRAFTLYFKQELPK